MDPLGDEEEPVRCAFKEFGATKMYRGGGETLKFCLEDDMKPEDEDVERKEGAGADGFFISGRLMSTSS